MSEARTPALDRAGIAATYELIRPHVRTTPVVEADGADFGLAQFPIRSVAGRSFDGEDAFNAPLPSTP